MSKRPEYSVYQFPDARLEIGDQEIVRRHVMLDEAIAAFRHYTSNVAARLGFTHRVIITDGGDCIVCEWIYGQGVTWPMRERQQQEGSDESTEQQKAGAKTAGGKDAG